VLQAASLEWGLALLLCLTGFDQGQLSQASLRWGTAGRREDGAERRCVIEVVEVTNAKAHTDAHARVCAHLQLLLLIDLAQPHLGVQVGLLSCHVQVTHTHNLQW